MSSNQKSDSTRQSIPSEDSKKKPTSQETPSERPPKTTAASELEAKQGFRGIEADPTPNENYTVAGVVAGKPTPETDYDQAVEVREAAKPADKLPADHPASKHLQKVADEETEQGFRGTEVDSTPNENYTVAGVTSGKPTPENDAETAKNVRVETGSGLSGIEQAQNEKAANAEKVKKSKKKKNES